MAPKAKKPGHGVSRFPISKGNLPQENLVHINSVKTELASPYIWEYNWSFMKSEESVKKEAEVTRLAAQKTKDLPMGLLPETAYPFKERIRRWKALDPHDKLTRPALSSQAYGWNKPIDRYFNSAEFGVKRTDLLPGRLQEDNEDEDDDSDDEKKPWR